jgi:predicted RNase H-like HicB family nuclease
MFVGHINSMNLAKIDVNAEWDAKANVWVASSDDLPALVTEADTLEDLQRKLAVMIPELLEANNVKAENDVRKIPINLIARLAMMDVPQANARSAAPRFRERELEWRRTHAETLRQFENEWVVLQGDEIIAHGSDAARVIQEARARGIKRPYVFFVEQMNENVITIGL